MMVLKQINGLSVEKSVKATRTVLSLFIEHFIVLAAAN